MSLSEIDYAPKMPPAIAQSRRTVWFQAEAGGGPFSSGQIARIQLTGADYLDPQALWLRFRVNISAPGAIAGTTVVGGITGPSGAESFFSRGRLMAGSTQIMDINPWDLWNSFLDASENTSVAATSSSILRGVDLDAATRAVDACIGSRHMPFTAAAGVLGGEYNEQTFTCPLSGFGLLAEKKLIPLRFIAASTPLTLELTVNSAAACLAIQNPSGTTAGTPPTSVSFTIDNVGILSDVLDMPDASSEFDRQLAQGGEIPYPFMRTQAYPHSIGVGATSAALTINHVAEDIVGVVVLFQSADRNADRSTTATVQATGGAPIVSSATSCSILGITAQIPTGRRHLPSMG
eukprot:TRINITY_DN344_c1_g1_i1.p3 TRINITY_DN344_c1_g1~~TRINITY_DN344_c1_g1_i1.p3  ORF type:complete len:348 (-),score=45.71 TRINITY_DN344_c1_g1_i1:1542-2585(-)